MPAQPRLPIAVRLLAIVTASARAERPPEPKAQADLIVTGQVGKVDSHTDPTDINYLIEIEVRSIDKRLGSRSWADGDSRSGETKVRHHLGNLAARGSKAFPKSRRCVGPTRAGDFGLRAQVEVTDARNAPSQGQAEPASSVPPEPLTRRGRSHVKPGEC